jgi:hypothetical protein
LSRRKSRPGDQNEAKNAGVPAIHGKPHQGMLGLRIRRLWRHAESINCVFLARR